MYTKRETKKYQVWSELRKVNRRMGGAVGLSEICHYLKMKPSTHLRKILEEMAREGTVEIIEYQYRENVIARRYRALVVSK